MSHQTPEQVLRILDANLNRLREALRVIEEHYRFVDRNDAVTSELKGIRHSLESIEQTIGRSNLLQNRDTETDPFAGATQKEELNRCSESDVLTANFKRSQEAARVLEEYLKLTGHPSLIEIAKKARFSMYRIEKQYKGV